MTTGKIAALMLESLYGFECEDAPKYEEMLKEAMKAEDQTFNDMNADIEAAVSEARKKLFPTG